MKGRSIAGVVVAASLLTADVPPAGAFNPSSGKRLEKVIADTLEIGSAEVDLLPVLGPLRKLATRLSDGSGNAHMPVREGKGTALGSRLFGRYGATWTEDRGVLTVRLILRHDLYESGYLWREAVLEQRLQRGDSGWSVDHAAISKVDGITNRPKLQLGYNKEWKGNGVWRWTQGSPSTASPDANRELELSVFDSEGSTAEEDPALKARFAGSGQLEHLDLSPGMTKRVVEDVLALPGQDRGHFDGVGATIAREKAGANRRQRWYLRPVVEAGAADESPGVFLPLSNRQVRKVVRGVAAGQIGSWRLRAPKGIRRALNKSVL